MRHFLYRLKYHYGRFLPLKKPVDISLELSSYCNMKCTYCYHAEPNSLPFTRGYMDLDTAYKIIGDGAQLSIPSIKFNWKGESTMNPNYARILQFAYNCSLSLSGAFIDRLVNSNFKFDTDNNEIFEALSLCTKVKVSYDSFSADVFNKQRAGGDWALTTKNLRKFHDLYLNPKKTTLVIQAVRTVLNKDEDIEALVKAKFPMAEVSIRDMVDGRLNKDVSELSVKKRDFNARKPCKQAFVRLIFNSEGIAMACCPDTGEKIQLGDINNQSIYEIFNGTRAKALRNSLKDGSAFDSEPCKSCSSFESFKGGRVPWNS